MWALNQISNYFHLRIRDKKYDSSVSGLFSSEYPCQVIRRIGLAKMTTYRHYPTYGSPLKGYNPKVKAFALIPAAVTQHTTAWCSMQVVDITQVKHRFARIISLRVVQQKHMRVQGMSIELQL